MLAWFQESPEHADCLDDYTSDLHQLEEESFLPHPHIHDQHSRVLHKHPCLKSNENLFEITNLQ